MSNWGTTSLIIRAAALALSVGLIVNVATAQTADVGANDAVDVSAPGPGAKANRDTATADDASASSRRSERAGGRDASARESSGGLLGTPTPQPVYAQEQKPLGTQSDADGTVPKPQGSSGGMGSWGLQTAMALAVVIALIFALRVWLRKMAGAPATPTARGLVEVLGRSTVGPKTQVLFLRVNERVIVAGQTPAGINTLTCIDDPNEVATLLAQAEADRPQSISQGFGKLLKQFERGEGDDDAPRADSRRQNDSTFDRARDELGGLIGRLRSMRQSDSERDERDRP